MNKAAFESYVETQLAFGTRPGRRVRRGARTGAACASLLDNLSSHERAKAAECLKAAGCWLFRGLRGLWPRSAALLPAYSPDLNLIEMAFSKLKAHLKRIGARTIEDLRDAIASVLDIFSPEKCFNDFDAAGYELI